MTHDDLQAADSRWNKGGLPAPTAATEASIGPDWAGLRAVRRTWSFAGRPRAPRGFSPGVGLPRRKVATWSTIPDQSDENHRRAEGKA